MFKIFRWAFGMVIFHCWIFLPKVSFAQKKVQWSLVILSEMDKKPVLRARVVCNNHDIYLTQEDGRLNLNYIMGKDVHIHVSCVGFIPLEKHLYLKKESQTDTIFLKAEVFELEEVNVTDKFYKKNPLSTSQTLSKSDLERVSGENLANQLAQLQGVRTLQTGATIAKPVINGMHGNRILILNNGVRQEGQQWGIEHAPEIDPFIAQSISVIRGAESVRYGADAIGGVVLINPPQLPVADKIHGEMDVIYASNGRKQNYAATLQGNFPKYAKWGWRTQGSYARSGDMKAANYFLTNTGTQVLHFSSEIGYTGKNIQGSAYASHFNGELGILKASNVGNQEDLKVRIDAGKPFITYPFGNTIEAPRQKIRHDLFKIRSKISLKNDTEIDLQYSFQRNHRQEYDIRRGSRTSIPSLDLNLYSQNLNASWKKDYQNKWRSEMGAQGAVQVNNNTPGTFVTPLIPNYDSYGIGIYTLQKYTQKNAIFEAGLRYDYKYLNAAGYNKADEWYGGIFNFHNVSWNLAAEFHLSPSLHFNSNMGMAWRPPQVNELFSTGLHHGTATVERGESKLQSENALKWVNTFTLHADKMEFEMSLFGQLIKNYIYLNPTLQLDTSIRGIYPIFQYQQNNALFIGGDLWMKYHFGTQLSYEAKISIVQAKNLSQNNFFPLIPSNNYVQTLTYELPIWRKLKQNYIQLVHQYTARQKRYNPNSDFAEPPAGYSLWNFQMGTSVPVSNQNLSTHLSINNIFNTAYKDYMNRFRYYADDVGRNIQIRVIYKF